MGKFALILPAAGRSSRFAGGKEKKVFSDLDGRAVWLRAVEPFLNRDDVGQIIVVISPEDRELFERRFRANVAFLGIKIIDGGAERSDSVAMALDALDPSCDFVAIHDAARPCLATESIDAVFSAAQTHGAALLAIPVSDTLKRADDQGTVVATIERENLFQAQTPQVFRRDWIVEAYARRQSSGTAITDDAQLVEALGHHCRIVAGSPLNLKITRHPDLLLAAAILKALPKPSDKRPIHPFGDDRGMWSDDPKPKRTF